MVALSRPPAEPGRYPVKAMHDSNPYESNDGDREKPTQVVRSGYSPVTTGIFATLFCGFVLLLICPTLNRLNPWGQGILPDWMMLRRDSGMIYAIKSVLISALVGIVIANAHNWTLRNLSLSLNSRSLIGIGFALLGWPVSFFITKLMVS